jgi:hypothetical protein
MGNTRAHQGTSSAPEWLKGGPGETNTAAGAILTPGMPM